MKRGERMGRAAWGGRGVTFKEIDGRLTHKDEQANDWMSLDESYEPLQGRELK